jgi:hypothetical protein
VAEFVVGHGLFEVSAGGVKAGVGFVEFFQQRLGDAAGTGCGCGVGRREGFHARS